MPPKWFPHPTCLPDDQAESRGTLRFSTKSSMTVCPFCFFRLDVSLSVDTAQASLVGGGGQVEPRVLARGTVKRVGYLWPFSRSVKGSVFQA